MRCFPIGWAKIITPNCFVVLGSSGDTHTYWFIPDQNKVLKTKRDSFGETKRDRERYRSGEIDRDR